MKRFPLILAKIIPAVLYLLQFTRRLNLQQDYARINPAINSDDEGSAIL
jgi:hypothetical protein